MFGKKQKKKQIEYDPNKKLPILKCSICNGEQVAGFKDKQTGKFEDVMLIKSNKDLEDFMAACNITSITKEY